MSFTETNFENAVIELFQSMGYTYLYGPDVARDYRCPLFLSELENSLLRLNPRLPQDAISDVLHKLQNFEGGSLVQNNAEFTAYLQNGISVKYFEKGEEKSGICYLVDYENLGKNSFYVINQWSFEENSIKRPDVMLFINGLPLVLVELKSPSREETNASEAYLQIRNYMHEIPSLFTYNMVCVMSDQLTSKAGTISSGENRYMEWKTKDGSYENTRYAQFDTFFEGMFDKARFLDILKNFICFSNDGKEQIKILAGYHQYFAVKKAVESTVSATQTDGKGGVFWHTQGSGKSLSMVFYAHLLQARLDSPTIVVLTDRNDLDDQLYSQFSKCKDFLRQTPVQATCRKITESSTKEDVGLKDYLFSRQANGIIFTTMQKFEESDEPLSERRNIIVMADEAHRGQYGLKEKVTQSGEIKIGTARKIRNSLPGATYIGFTGTPISSKDRSTREVFGDYIDVYDMTQAVEDGATRPVYYESRVIKLKLDEKVLRQLDDQYEEFAQLTDDYTIEQSKKDLAKMDAVLGAEQTIHSLVSDIIEHYENYRANLLTGKAMIVAYSRDIAMQIYSEMLALRPDWQEKVKVVITETNKDPEDWRPIIGNKKYKEELARKFKDNDDPMKIAIVVDMWLTGFDVPSLATMYVYKPMAGHNLMQAIARVNRVFTDKEGGLVVDYVGIASALKQAMNDYTNRDKSNYSNTDIKNMAYPKFLEKLSVCKQLFHGFDYSVFATGTDLQRANQLTDAVNFIIAPDKAETQKLFIKEALLLRQALSLCASMASAEQRLEAAFFEAVRTMVVRLSQNGGRAISLKEINHTINELLSQSVHSDGVINLFADVKEEFSLFDPKFLEEIGAMKQKNLAIEILKKLLNEQVKLYSKTNLVKSEKFSEKLQRLMNSYINGLISNEEVIEELKKLAQEMAQANDESNSLGLSPEELAFYDALTKPQAVKDFYNSDVLIEMTRELTEELRKNRTIDWQKKESARASMRKLVKRLLKRYKYPPDGVEDAMDTILRQCEQWVDND
ncbi:MAG: type I restriction endonuclease subunit R [Clostridiaceae bacterium]|nr:type I restriction endonuclease subunit R [Clostridiaceae bacterium]